MSKTRDGFYDLADVWNGESKTYDPEEDTLLHRADLLIDPTVPDDAMACGGRVALHERLSLRRTKEGQALLHTICGSCAVQKSCIFGS